MPRISKLVDNGSIEGDWVFFGVLSHKREPASTKSGSGKYMIVELNDMKGTTISVFLFGAAFEAHWKERLGMLVCVANAELLPSSEGRSIALKIANKHQLLPIGEVTDVCSHYDVQ